MLENEKQLINEIENIPKENHARKIRKLIALKEKINACIEWEKWYLNRQRISRQQKK